MMRMQHEAVRGFAADGLKVRIGHQLVEHTGIVGETSVDHHTGERAGMLTSGSETFPSFAAACAARMIATAAS